MITRNGYVVSNPTPELKKSLTLTPIVNTDFGPKPQSIKCYRIHEKGVIVPLYSSHASVAEDTRVKPRKMSEDIHFTGKLRKETHQIEAFRSSVDAGHGVISLPCGFGKTTVALAIACHFKLRTMIIVHKEFLANQWRERIQQFCPGSTIGLVQQDIVNVKGCDFVIAMLQSLSSKEYKPNEFDTIGTVIVDEAHHICARVFSRALFKICPLHIYGLSATPTRKDGLTDILHMFMGPTTFSIERQNQASVEVTMVPYTCEEYSERMPHNRCGKVSVVNMITTIVENTHRTDMIIKLILDTLTSEPSRKILVLTDRRNHCQELYAKLPDGMSGLYMGGMKEADLQKSSEKQVIIGTFSQAHEGLDIPTLDSLILATPKSDIKQSVGRILRETPGKVNNPKIWDIRDYWGILNAMYMKRCKVYTEGGFNINGEKPEKLLDGFNFIV